MAESDQPRWSSLTPVTDDTIRALAQSALFNDVLLPLPDDLGIGIERYALSDERPVEGETVCVIGAFDGVHRGHQELIAKAAADAKWRSLPLVIVTFVPDPAEVLEGYPDHKLLMTAADRLKALSIQGADGLIIFPFTKELARLGYDEFVDERLVPMAKPVAIHVGQDFHLGASGAGTVEALGVYCSSLDIDVFGESLLTMDGEPVSASRIRALVESGDVEEAAKLLGRPYAVEGVVERGRGEGTGLGFPTANIHVQKDRCLPKDGVFAALVTDGETVWPSAVNVGQPPSFEGTEDDTVLVEAALLGFTGDLYGEDLSVIFLEKLRDSRPFATKDELVSTVKSNIAWVRRHVGEEPVALQAPGEESFGAMVAPIPTGSESISKPSESAAPSSEDA